MFKTTKTKIIALALVGVVALGGAIYATSALAAGGATAAPATVVTTSPTAADPQLRATILDMLKDRMGLSGADAETFADQMIARMQSVNPNFDLNAMVNWCNQYIGDNTAGRGMMGDGTNPNGAPNGAYCNPSSPGRQTGGQTSGSSYGPRGMMGGGMMGLSGLR